MKLIDMLVEDGLNGWQWSDGVECITQDNGSIIYKGVAFGYAKKPHLKGNIWLANNGTGHADAKIKRYDVVADDWFTAIITREQYESALAAKNDGWIEWGGGECPVPDGALVEVQYRNRTAFHVAKTSDATLLRWSQDGSDCDIIAYRMSMSAEKYAQFEASQVWNGEGLPPVGCECERSWAGDKWLSCEILFTSNQLIVVKLKESGIEKAYNIGEVTFRPIRSEEDEKRDKMASAIDGFISGFRGQETGSNKELAYALADYLALIDKL